MIEDPDTKIRRPRQLFTGSPERHLCRSNSGPDFSRAGGASASPDPHPRTRIACRSRASGSST